jgi:hypothetical protein
MVKALYQALSQTLTTMTPDNAMGFFRTCGSLYPLNKENAIK